MTMNEKSIAFLSKLRDLICPWESEIAELDPFSKNIRNEINDIVNRNWESIESLNEGKIDKEDYKRTKIDLKIEQAKNDYSNYARFLEKYSKKQENFPRNWEEVLKTLLDDINKDELAIISRLMKDLDSTKKLLTPKLCANSILWAATQKDNDNKELYLDLLLKWIEDKKENEEWDKWNTLEQKTDGILEYWNNRLINIE